MRFIRCFDAVGWILDGELVDSHGGSSNALCVVVVEAGFIVAEGFMTTLKAHIFRISHSFCVDGLDMCGQRMELPPAPMWRYVTRCDT